MSSTEDLPRVEKILLEVYNRLEIEFPIPVVEETEVSGRVSIETKNADEVDGFTLLSIGTVASASEQVSELGYEYTDLLKVNDAINTVATQGLFRAITLFRDPYSNAFANYPRKRVWIPGEGHEPVGTKNIYLSLDSVERLANEDSIRFVAQDGDLMTKSEFIESSFRGSAIDYGAYDISLTDKGLEKVSTYATKAEDRIQQKAVNKQQVVEAKAREEAKKQEQALTTQLRRSSIFRRILDK